MRASSVTVWMAKANPADQLRFTEPSRCACLAGPPACLQMGMGSERIDSLKSPSKSCRQGQARTAGPQPPGRPISSARGG